MINPKLFLKPLLCRLSRWKRHNSSIVEQDVYNRILGTHLLSKLFHWIEVIEIKPHVFKIHIVNPCLTLNLFDCIHGSLFASTGQDHAFWTFTLCEFFDTFITNSSVGAGYDYNLIFDRAWVSIYTSFSPNSKDEDGKEEKEEKISFLSL